MEPLLCFLSLGKLLFTKKKKKEKKPTAKQKVSLITNFFLLAEFTKALKIVEL